MRMTGRVSGLSVLTRYCRDVGSSVTGVYVCVYVF